MILLVNTMGRWANVLRYCIGSGQCSYQMENDKKQVVAVLLKCHEK